MENITSSSDDYFASNYTGTEQTVLATILTFIIVFSLYGNGGMIIVLYKNDRMWNSTNILIGNLAVAAFLTTLLIMPFSLTSMVLKYWPFAEGPICKFNAFLASQLLLYTIFIHTMISIDKYFAVVKPFSRAMTVRRTWTSSFILWTIAIFMSLGPLIHIGEYRYNRTALVCGVGFPKNKIDSIYMLFLFALGFIIPNIVNAHVYFKVFRAVRIHTKRISKTSVTSTCDVMKLQQRLVLTAFCSLACFLLCWTPFAVYVAMAVTSKSIDSIPHGLGVSAYWSGYMYNAINPLIICTMSTRFGDGIYELTISILRAPFDFYDFCKRGGGWEQGKEGSNTSSTTNLHQMKRLEPSPTIETELSTLPRTPIGSDPALYSSSSSVSVTAESSLLTIDCKQKSKENGAKNIVSSASIVLTTNKSQESLHSDSNPA
eukprot:TCONS_00034984-protein